MEHAFPSAAAHGADDSFSHSSSEESADILLSELDLSEGNPALQRGSRQVRQANKQLVQRVLHA